jgi:hypothetical protein
VAGTYDELLNKYGFSDASAAEETNLTTTGVGSEKIDDLDTGLENFGDGRLIHKFWSIRMDGKILACLDGATFINRLANNIHDTSECSGLVVSDRSKLYIRQRES